MSEPGVVCVGGAVVDLKYTLRAPAVLETSNPAAASTSFGGVARNVAENLAALGVGVRLVSATGDDAAATALRAHLKDVGVDTEQVLERVGRASAQYVAVLDPDGDLVLGIAAMDVLDSIGPAELDAGWPGDRSGNGSGDGSVGTSSGGPPAEWVFCDANLSTAVLAHALKRARSDGVRLVLDAVSTHKVTRLPADLSGAALLSLNVDEARAYLAAHGRDFEGAPARLALRLRQGGPDAVLLTLGARGVVVAGPDGVRLVPAPDAVPVDVTGAGDALVAGTVAAMLRGGDVYAAAAAGTRRAARTVESPLSVLPPGAS